ncbi:MAG: DUF342 domain-containing protein [Planctomycetes bacterium]|nr:DUF342 domain-containing protein [Planctomycetota bacterium]
MSAVLTQKALSDDSFEIPESDQAGDWVVALNEAGITYGIDEELLHSFCGTRELKEDKLIVAKGKEPVFQGVRIQYHYELAKIQKADAESSSNYFDLGFGIDTFAGELLAEQVVNHSGEDGMNLFGETIPHKKIGGNPLNYNNYVTIEKTGNHTRFLSKIDGVIINDSTDNIEVQPELVLRKNVDYKVGNLSLKCPISIEGNIQPGFFVRSEKDIHIKGTVEKNALVDSGGSIFLDGGVTPSATLIAGENIQLKYAQGATLKAGCDIEASSYLIDCQAKAAKVVRCTNQNPLRDKGSVIGGTINGIQAIDLVTVGSANALTTLATGVDLELNTELHEAEESLTQVSDEMSRKTRQLSLNILDKDFVKKLHALPEDEKKLNLAIVQNILELRSRKKNLGSQIKHINEEISKTFCEGEITIHKELFADVNIIINDCNTSVCHNASQVKFRKEHDQIKTVEL